MSDAEEWSFPEHLQPDTGNVSFDLDAVLSAIVNVRAEIPDDAFTASTLGTERVGNGVVIREDGVVLTIGYLITEAETIWLTTNEGKVIPGYPLSYDQATGFGLIQPLGQLGVANLNFGSASRSRIGDDVLFVGQGGRQHALKAKLVDKREFAGYWEYVLDEALFVAPAHPQWGGAALIGGDGQLLGIGSLLVQEAVDGQTVQGNMVVPIDLLKPILENMIATGAAGTPPRPWLGMYTTESGKNLIVGGVAEHGPAAKAGIKQGDLVLEVAGKRINSLAQLFRTAWQTGPAGTNIPLTVAREGDVLRFEVKSADRNDFLKKPRLH
ncbi:MAG: PDZ domain-containing protein [Burkholderiales bacterium]|nr:PDZ domain-containing protein [Burkholderiales bacterium]